MFRFGPQREIYGFAVAALLSVSCTLRAEVLIVAGARGGPVTLSQSQVSDLFVGKFISFPDGKKLVPIDQPESSPLREEFYSKVAHKSAAQVKANWAKLYFTGRGVPPREGASSEEVKKLLNSIPGAIGYIDQASLDRSVNLIQIIRPGMADERKGGDFGN